MIALFLHFQFRTNPNVHQEGFVLTNYSMLKQWETKPHFKIMRLPIIKLHGNAKYQDILVNEHEII